MKHRGLQLAAALAAVVMGVSGCGGGPGGGGGDNETPDNLTVWFMPEAQENWPKAIKAANEEFEKRHPDVKVEVREQDWGQYLTKFEAQLGSGEPPDVLELGNTQTAKYMASGALLDITDKKKMFDNSGAWLDALEQSCTFEGRLYCVPYYAAARGIVYRTDMFEQAGVSGEPQSLAEFNAAMDKLMAEFGDKSNFSAWYFPGKYWYAAMAFVYDYGGQIAQQQNGQWRGTLDSPEARQALTKLKDMVDKYSRASKTGDEESRNEVFAEGHVASLYAVSYDAGVITNPEAGGNADLKGKLDAIPMPSHTPGKVMPSFLGGSDLAVPASSDAPDLALEWVSIFTSEKSMAMMVEASTTLPNNTNQLKLAGGDSISDAFAEAGKRTWFVPSAENWATVEQRNVIPNMLVSIFTEQATVEEATTKASEQITEILAE